MLKAVDCARKWKAKAKRRNERIYELVEEIEEHKALLAKHSEEKGDDGVSEEAGEKSGSLNVTVDEVMETNEVVVADAFMEVESTKDFKHIDGGDEEPHED
uniref:Uncharacterized protein n=1 Tax=Nelumbo nucifera TaxID=4432 RepID=A0A822XL58_NELNU|nr:TPA_asm: hypothetical protein HUJ06_022573 [Nelumbo nucifera]